ncbi:MAG: quinolinate synthase NadA, partial [Bacteroidia bacterium]|nr:quinolinate synthase NadA [Bacteroidia bacterium]
TALLRYTQQSPAKTFVVATEPGILHRMRAARPDATFIPAPSNQTCACNHCPHMKLNTLEKVYLTLLYELPELTMDEELRLAALKPIERMLELSRGVS